MQKCVRGKKKSFVSHVHQQAVICEEVSTQDGRRDGGEDERPGEKLAKCKIEVQFALSISLYKCGIDSLKWVGTFKYRDIIRGRWKNTKLSTGVN